MQAASTTIDAMKSLTRKGDRLLSPFLNYLFQFCNHGIYLFLRIVFAEGKPHGHQVGIVVDSPDDMRALVGAAGAGAAARGADIVHVKIK